MLGYPDPMLGYPDTTLEYPDTTLGYPDTMLGYPDTWIVDRWIGWAQAAVLGGGDMEAYMEEWGRAMGPMEEAPLAEAIAATRNQLAEAEEQSQRSGPTSERRAREAAECSHSIDSAHLINICATSIGIDMFREYGIFTI
eukprot:4578505-Pyramimonas_sp.AAC.2